MVKFNYMKGGEIMSKSGFDFSGFDDFTNQLDELSDIVETNASNTEGQLSVETDFILENLNEFNIAFDSSFSTETSDEEYLEYFGNAYQIIVSEGIFEKDYDPKQIFNAKYKPYAKIN